MSEKEEMRKRADTEIKSDADAVTLFVDLDAPETLLATERHSGLSVVKITVVKDGQKLHVWLHLETVGHQFVEKLGHNLVVSALKFEGEESNKINFKLPRHGWPMEKK